MYLSEFPFVELIMIGRFMCSETARNKLIQYIWV